MNIIKMLYLCLALLFWVILKLISDSWTYHFAWVNEFAEDRAYAIGRKIVPFHKFIKDNESTLKYYLYFERT
jgi:hypothetical protein